MEDKDNEEVNPTQYKKELLLSLTIVVLCAR